MTETHESSAEPGDLGPAVFEQILELFIRPEVERRRAEGRLADGTSLQAAQVICFPDARPNLVRLNEEVRAIAKVKLKDGVSKKEKDPVFADEIAGYETVLLPETEDPDCGHATMLRLGGRWFVVFDFRYNRGRSRVLLARARQFLETAAHALERQSWSPFVYNLFTTAELAAKAELLSLPDPGLLKARKHNAVKSRLNRWARLGNVDTAHSSAFNRLTDLRSAAAYSMAEFSLDDEAANELHGAVVDLVQLVAARVSAELPRGATELPCE